MQSLTRFETYSVDTRARPAGYSERNNLCTSSKARRACISRVPTSASRRIPPLARAQNIPDWRIFHAKFRPRAETLAHQPARATASPIGPRLPENNPGSSRYRMHLSVCRGLPERTPSSQENPAATLLGAARDSSLRQPSCLQFRPLPEREMPHRTPRLAELESLPAISACVSRASFPWAPGIRRPPLRPPRRPQGRYPPPIEKALYLAGICPCSAIARSVRRSGRP